MKLMDKILRRKNRSIQDFSQLNVQNIKRNISRERCTICLNEIEDNEVKLECKHKFHFYCLILLILKTKQGDKCPNCRNKIKLPELIYDIKKRTEHIKKLEEQLKLCAIEIKNLEKILNLIKL